MSKPYLRTSGKLKILQIKKYLNKKINELRNTQGKMQDTDVQLYCQGTLLGDELR